MATCIVAISESRQGEMSQPGGPAFTGQVHRRPGITAMAFFMFQSNHPSYPGLVAYAREEVALQCLPAHLGPWIPHGTVPELPVRGAEAERLLTVIEHKGFWFVDGGRTRL